MSDALAYPTAKNNMSMQEYRPLMLRGNRFLGSALVKANLITIDQLEEANQKLLDIIHGGQLKQASILNILSFEMGVLDESDVISYTADENDLGMVDLRNYDILNTYDKSVDVDLCWATWTIPYDVLEGIHMVATSNYLSLPTVQHWEQKLGGKVVWYISSNRSLSHALEILEAEYGEKDSEAEAATH